MARRFLSLVALTLGTASIHALPAQSPAPGHRLWGPLGGTDTLLIDNLGNTLHTWPSTFTPGVAVYLQPDGLLLRTINTRPPFTPTGPGGTGGGLQRVEPNGNVVWDFRYDGPGFVSHHDVELLPNGNVLMLVWDDISFVTAWLAGRRFDLLGSGFFRPDRVIEVQQTGPTTGDVVWEWRVWDHLIQDTNPAASNFGVVGDHPGRIDLNFPAVVPTAGDWNHCNSIDYDPVHDRIAISAREQSEVWIIDHSTTILEAAGSSGGRSGKGGDLLYRWGNPQSYRAGTIFEQKLFGQHSAVFVAPGYPGEGNLLVFNNKAIPGQSAVWELELPTDAATGAFVLDANTGQYGPSTPAWSYTAPGFFSPFVSNCQRLPNGTTLICSGFQGEVFEVDKLGNVVWSYATPNNGLLFHAHYIPETLWSRRSVYSLSAGLPLQLDMRAGLSNADAPYVLLGSLTGTSPGFSAASVNIPLVPDAYTRHTLSFLSSPPLLNGFGELDANGDASAFFGLPPGLPPVLAGIEFHHAFVILDVVAGGIRQASNASSFVLTP